jgi:hypothetical protein
MVGLGVVVVDVLVGGGLVGVVGGGGVGVGLADVVAEPGGSAIPRGALRGHLLIVEVVHGRCLGGGDGDAIDSK